ncbi:MAG TPA: V-type ATP synthase subunit F [Syntrophorhabdaceae bacterium]|nr:V-type ATP synthase subunit F [Syntrophorhabdaceae bacterium]
MKFFCIGDDYTAHGFRLIGVDAKVVTTPKEAESTLMEILTKQDYGVVIIDEETANWIRPHIDRIRMELSRPLIVEIPGPKGPTKLRKSLREFVQEAVGISVS